MIAKSISVATLVGLLVALGGVALLASPASRWLGDPAALRTRVFEQLALWVLFAVVLGIVVFWEGRPLSSIGVQAAWVGSLALAGVLAAFVSLVVSPLAMHAVATGGFAPLKGAVSQFHQLPMALKVFAVLTAGIVEETLFRGYALERLAGPLGSIWVAAAVTLVFFAAVHWPVWGGGGVLVILCTAGAFTIFYVWQRDLVANAVAHVAVDAIGLIITPMLAARD